MTEWWLMFICFSFSAEWSETLFTRVMAVQAGIQVCSSSPVQTHACVVGRCEMNDKHSFNKFEQSGLYFGLQAEQHVQLRLNLTLSPFYLQFPAGAVVCDQASSQNALIEGEVASHCHSYSHKKNKKNVQTSVSRPTTVASPPVLRHAILLLLCMSDVPLLGP